MRQVLQLLHQW